MKNIKRISMILLSILIGTAILFACSNKPSDGDENNGTEEEEQLDQVKAPIIVIKKMVPDTSEGAESDATTQATDYDDKEFNKDDSLHIWSETGGDITYYTLDGSDPNPDNVDNSAYGNDNSKPTKIFKSTVASFIVHDAMKEGKVVVKAISVKDGMKDSEITTKEFDIPKIPSIPVDVKIIAGEYPATGVKVSWNPGAVDDYHSVATRFTIKYLDGHQRSNVPLNDRDYKIKYVSGILNYAYIEGLSPESECNFKMWAENEFGQSNFTEEIKHNTKSLGDKGQVEDPEISPQSGEFTTKEENITIKVGTPSAYVFYTLDGSEPQITVIADPSTGSVYPAPTPPTKMLTPADTTDTQKKEFSISGTDLEGTNGENLGSMMNIRFVACKNIPKDDIKETQKEHYPNGMQMINSNEVKVTYTLFAETVKTPVIGTAAGDFDIANGEDLKITCATPGATIFYTLDGSIPTMTDNGDGTYTETPPTKMLMPADETVTEFSIPKNSLGSAGEEIEIKVMSAKKTMRTSKISDGVKYMLVDGKVETPTINPSTGEIKTSDVLTVTCATPGATIFYTFDGSTTPEATALKADGSYTDTQPTDAIKVLHPSDATTTTFTIDAYDLGADGDAITLRVIAAKKGKTVSDESSVDYSITTEKIETPTISPESGDFDTSTLTNITITCATPGATIFYTQDGSTIPEATALKTDGSGDFEDPADPADPIKIIRPSDATAKTFTLTMSDLGLSLGDTVTLKFVASKKGMDTSDMTEDVTYTFVSGKVAKPTITPDGGLFNSKTETATIACATGGATIFYTMNGSDPVIPKWDDQANAYYPTEGLQTFTHDGNPITAERMKKEANSMGLTIKEIVITAIAVKHTMSDSDKMISTKFTFGFNLETPPAKPEIISVELTNTYNSAAGQKQVNIKLKLPANDDSVNEYFVCLYGEGETEPTSISDVTNVNLRLRCPRTTDGSDIIASGDFLIGDKYRAKPFAKNYEGTITPGDPYPNLIVVE